MAKELAKLDQRFTVKNDVTIKGAQIDHLVLFEQGSLRKAFVIETKLWGGDITGTASSRYWDQHKDGAILQLYSPIKQNQKHCEVVRQKYGFIPVQSVVCMCGKGNFPRLEGVVHLSELTDYLCAKV